MEQSEQTDRSWPLRTGSFVFILLVSAIVFCTYRHAYLAPFVLDDEDAIINNATIRDLSRFSAVLSPPRASGVGGRPLVNFTYALNYGISGMNPWSYHAFNIGLHLATGAFLFAALKEALTRFCSSTVAPRDSTWVAAIIAVLWLLHPIQTESVIYISQRTECLAALCYVSAFYYFLRSTSESAVFKWKVASILSCALGMLCKETMVTAPFFILVFDVYFISGSFIAAYSLRRGFYIALASTWILLAVSVFDLSTRSVGFGRGFSWWNYALLESQGLFIYFFRTIWPSNLLFDYGALSSTESTAHIPYALGILALIILTALGLKTRCKSAFIPLGLFILLSPSSSIIPVMMQPIAEHRMYLASALIILGFVLTFYSLMERKSLIVLSIFVLGMAVATDRRAFVYRNAVSLWEDTCNKSPRNTRALTNLGYAYDRVGRTAEAISTFRRVLDLDSNDHHAEVGLGNIWYDEQNYSAAAQAFERAVKLAPGKAKYFANLGNALLNLGKIEEANLNYRRALQMDDDLVEVHHNLGCTLAASGDPAGAFAEFQKALKLNPDYTPSRDAIVKLEWVWKGLPIGQ